MAPPPRPIRPMPLSPPTCHSPGPASAAARGAVQVALIGLPNTGKSTLFNRLTGGHAQIANWPGLTVDLLRGSLPPGPDGRPYELVDLPGIHDFSGSSEDEAIVQRFLRNTPPDLVVVVLNASQVVAQLRLPLQLRSLGLPTVVALNMSDEARRWGVHIDVEALARGLGLPVLPISALRREGLGELREAIHSAARHTPAAPTDPEALEALRLELAARCVRLPARPPNRTTQRLDRLLLHPLVGPLLFLAIMAAMFQAIYSLGAPLQEGLGLLLDSIRQGLLQPALQQLGAPALLQGFLLDGVWLGVGTVASFLPIILFFYLLLALVEDSGYLPRAAFLTDGLMHWLGLDGRAFVLQVMGFGCNVPAILGTRVIRDRSMRLLAMMVIPFALCQARLAVFVFLAGVFFPRPWWAPGLVVFAFYLLSFAAAIITGLIFKHAYPHREALVLELPPYRRPSPATMLRRAWGETRRFLVTTRGFIVLGAALVWLLTNLPPGAAAGAGTNFADRIGGLLQPLLGPIGMNPALTVSLFFGFIAKEILLGAMAVIHHTSEAGLGAAIHHTLTPLQSLSFMTFVLLYTPCLSTVAVQIREAGSRWFALRSVAWSLALAWGASFVVYQGGRLLGVGP
ncbi:MAG: ferrous iron transport protein B [Synechococcaceae cyanobacterium]|nr:ferrous iron transport protein B [Synechococcaceae cyanobacterium]